MPPTRIITHAEMAKIPDGGAIYVEDGAVLTPLARERAAARQIELRPGADPNRSTNAKELEEAARRVLARLGPVSEAAVERIVSEVVATLQDDGGSSGLPAAADYCTAYLNAERRHVRRRAVLTTSGRNQKGIVARLTAVIAEFGADILDISQTLVGDYFTMLVIVDIAELSGTFEQFKEALTQAAQERGAQAILMHEDIVTAMHRV